MMYLYIAVKFLLQILKNWVQTNKIGGEHIEKSDGVHIGHFKSKARDKMRDLHSGRVGIYDDNIDATIIILLNKMKDIAHKFGTKVFLIDDLMRVGLECDSESRYLAAKKIIKDLIYWIKHLIS